MNSIMPMLMQIIQGIMALMTKMFGGGAAASNAANGGNAGNAGNPGGAGNPANAGNAGNGGNAGNAGNLGNAGDLGNAGNPGNAANAGNAAAINGDVNGASLLPNNPNVQANAGVNYSNIPEEQRAQFTHLNDNLSAQDERRAAGIIHLGGRAHISDSETASGVSSSARIYNNVLSNPGNFRPEEVSMIQEFAAKERAETAGLTPDGQGFVTGRYLDLAFIDQMGNRDGISQDKINAYKGAVNARVDNLMKSAQGGNAAAIIADSNTTIDIVSDVGTLEKRTGLNRTEQAAYRLAGHSVLFSKDGTVDADILGISYKNLNALDSQAGAGQDVNIDNEIEALASADSADDGQVNGSALRRANESVMDKIFLKQGGIQNNNALLQEGQQVGLRNGRTMGQITQSLTSGGMQALNDLKSLAKDHTPAMLAAGGSVAAASAVCPFLGGMAGGAAGIGAANDRLSKY